MKVAAPPATLTKDAFDAIARLAYRESGLKIVPEKKLMVQSRLRHRLRALNCANFDAYTNLVCSDDGADERRFMISALTTNVSHFFREPHHFELLSRALLPKLRTRVAEGGRIRIWSAGCSNGQEPYSIAMHLLRLEPTLATADFRILATDIDPKVIQFAHDGVFDNAQMATVSEQDRQSFFRTNSDIPNSFSVARDLAHCVTFKELNLLSEWPMRQPFDAIFCRNVVIYFDIATQERLWPRFHHALRPQGQFFLGHSERIASPAQFGFTTIGPTAYTKTDDSQPDNRPIKEVRLGTS